jgi:hypothetical protein
MFDKKVVRFIPFFILLICILYTCIFIFVNHFAFTSRQKFALILFGANIVAYLRNLKLGVIVTGLIFILATFDLIVLLPFRIYSSYYINFGDRRISTPNIQAISLLLTIIYLIFDYKLLIDIVSWKRKLIKFKLKNKVCVCKFSFPR